MNFLLPLFILATVSINGCVWRSSDAEYYFGPILFRHTQPPEAQAFVHQTIHFPFLLEGGCQWGGSLGVFDRVAILPIIENTGLSKSKEERSPEWDHRFSFSDSNQGDWTFSLVFLKGENLREPLFLKHTIYGARVSFGCEGNGMVAGASSKTRMKALNNTVHEFQFNSKDPMKAVFKVRPEP